MTRYARVLAAAWSVVSSAGVGGPPVAPAQPVAPSEYSLRARLVVGRREVRLYDYHLIASDLDLGHTACLSALFRDDTLRRRSRRLNGRFVYLHVQLCDYFARAATDPVFTVASNMQNECGGRYYAVIDSIGR